MGIYLHLRALASACLVILLLILLSGFTAQASGTVKPQQLQEYLLPSEAFVVSIEATGPSNSNSDVVLTIHWQIADGYYMYNDKFSAVVPTDSGDITLPLIFAAPQNEGEVQIIYDSFFERELTVHYNEVQMALTLPADVVGDMNRVLQLWSQGCSTSGYCYPPQLMLYDMQARSIIEDGVKDGFNAVADGDIEWLYAIVLAFLGGIILNFMPCVFPLIGVKLVSINAADGSVAHAWFYTLGIVCFFVCIAGIMLVLQYAGAIIGWGFQLQSAPVVGALAVLFFVLGLSFSGFTTLGLKAIGLGQNLTGSQSNRGHFFSGLLTVIVATPCTAPFMASALAYALLQPSWVSFVIFIALGLGLALPYLVLSYVPQWRNVLPRSGTWLLRLQQLMAIPLYITSLWLLSILFSILITQPNDEGFELAHLDTIIGKDYPVFVNVTAEWCISCKVNEAVTLNSQEVQTFFSDNKVQVLTIDWTTPNTQINELLLRYNRVGIPLYLYFPSYSNKAIILPQILLPDDVLQLL